MTLPCYNDGKRIPAYRAFPSSLVAICGEDAAARLTDHLDSGGGDIEIEIPDETYRNVKTIMGGVDTDA